MFRSGFDDIQVGDLKTSLGRTIDEADLLAYSMLSGDWAAHHIDAEYTARTRFQGRIAHGTIAPAAIYGLLRLPRDSTWELIHGLRTIRWIAPVRIGDTLRGVLEVKEKHANSNETGTLELLLTVRNQHGDDVMVAPLRSEVRRRSADD